MSNDSTMGRPRLLVSADVARGKIREQIKAGSELVFGRDYYSLGAHLGFEEELKETSRKARKWVKYTAEMLRSIVDSGVLADEFALYFEQLPPPGASLYYERAQWHDDYVEEKLGVLESIEERLEFYVPSEQPQPSKRQPQAASGGESAFVVHGHDEAVRQSVARFPGAVLRPDHPKGVPELPAALRADYDARGYLCHDKLFVTGRTLHRRSNLLIVNGNEITVEDSLFILLLRLVVELIKGEGGWVNRRALASEGIVGDPERFQPYSRLRRLLEGYLLDRDGRKFIENDRAKNYRISTHPDFVTYDKERLLLHPSQRVKDLAKTLP